MDQGHSFERTGSLKTNKGAEKYLSQRRSEYIGVSKNNNRYQALMNIKGKKHYLGTFKTALEAATTYDFYCIANKKTKATTNFSYTDNMIKAMILDYCSSEEGFNPTKVLDGLHTQ